MLVYIKCPTCSNYLTYNFEEYITELKTILNDPKMTPSAKEIARSKLLDKYGYEGQCCRSRILGYVPYHEIIVNTQQ